MAMTKERFDELYLELVKEDGYLSKVMKDIKKDSESFGLTKEETVSQIIAGRVALHNSALNASIQYANQYKSDETIAGEERKLELEIEGIEYNNRKITEEIKLTENRALLAIKEGERIISGIRIDDKEVQIKGHEICEAKNRAEQAYHAIEGTKSQTAQIQRQTLTYNDDLDVEQLKILGDLATFAINSDMDATKTQELLNDFADYRSEVRNGMTEHPVSIENNKTNVIDCGDCEC